MARPVTDFFVGLEMQDEVFIKSPANASPDSAYILAGGASRRMGSDKLFVDIDGEQLLARTIRICREVFAHVTLVAKEREKFAEFGVPVIIDAPDAPGPLGGLIAALEDCNSASCFVIAADLADIDTTIIQTLLKRYNGEDYLGLSESGRIQPLCGIYGKEALSALRSATEHGERYHLWRIVRNMRSVFIPAPQQHWRNINTPADLHKESRS